MKWSYTHSFKSSPPHWGSASPTVLQSLSNFCGLVQKTSSHQQCHQLDQLRSQRVQRQEWVSLQPNALLPVWPRESSQNVDKQDWLTLPAGLVWVELQWTSSKLTVLAMTHQRHHLKLKVWGEAPPQNISWLNVNLRKLKSNFQICWAMFFLPVKLRCMNCIKNIYDYFSNIVKW